MKKIRYIIGLGMFIYGLGILETNIAGGIIVLILSMITIICARFNIYL